MLAHALLTQFEDIEFEKISCPYLDSLDKAREMVARIDRTAREDGCRPLLFSTLIDKEVRDLIAQSNGLLIDFFDAFISPLEAELGIPSSHASGRSHGVGNYGAYKARIDAINFALANDDGVSTRQYPAADIVLIGVSRSGKTPTCLYLALQYGILAANYPLTENDLGGRRLPGPLAPYKEKLFGLSLQPERLQRIRSERRPDSRYARLEQCRYEVQAAEALFRREGIPFLDTSIMSIEEIATSIMHQTGLKRRLYG